jgi:hypothetical protein
MALRDAELAPKHRSTHGSARGPVRLVDLSRLGLQVGLWPGHGRS